MCFTLAVKPAPGVALVATDTRWTFHGPDGTPSGFEDRGGKLRTLPDGFVAGSGPKGRQIMATLDAAERKRWSAACPFERTPATAEVDADPDVRSVASYFFAAARPEGGGVYVWMLDVFPDRCLPLAGGALYAMLPRGMGSPDGSDPNSRELLTLLSRPEVPYLRRVADAFVWVVERSELVSPELDIGIVTTAGGMLRARGRSEALAEASGMEWTAALQPVR